VGRAIKGSHFTDNAVGIIHLTGPKLAKLSANTGRWCPPCASSSCARTPLAADVKDMIAGQLDTARERFAAIGHGHPGNSVTSQLPGAPPVFS
jgi:hypothetical protein